MDEWTPLSTGAAGQRLKEPREGAVPTLKKQRQKAEPSGSKVPAKDAPKILKGKLEEDDDKPDEEHVCVYI